jgi:hypothetical protein
MGAISASEGMVTVCADLQKSYLPKWRPDGISHYFQPEFLRDQQQHNKIFNQKPME